MTGRERGGALFVDLYELTMAQAYAAEGKTGTAVFETFFRELPASRNYMIEAGIDDVLTYLESHHFDPGDLEYLESLGLFSEQLIERLRHLRFTGDVWAVPEGTVVFAHEPILQVVAPLIEAQLIETFVINQIHAQSLVASKASRVVEAAQGRTVVEFGARRAHGTDAALKASRTSYLAGCAGTSNVQAGRLYGIPLFGTMAHSFVQAFGDEAAAFEAFARRHPGATLLVDTYNTLQGIDRVIALARKLGTRFDVAAVRLDSGDLVGLSRAARTKLDAAGLHQVRIVASSALDEYKVADLVARGAVVDGLGVGTKLAVSYDTPAIDMAYKLVEYEGVARTKLSDHKELYPCRKQVVRSTEAGRFTGDVVARCDEKLPGEPLLVPMMRAGKRLAHDGGLEAARRRAREQVQSLDPQLRALSRAERGYRVRISQTLLQQLGRLRAVHC